MQRYYSNSSAAKKKVRGHNTQNQTHIQNAFFSHSTQIIYHASKYIELMKEMSDTIPSNTVQDRCCKKK